MADDPKQSASVGDNGASVNIHFGNGFKQFQLIVIALFMSIALNLALALYAITVASEAAYHAREWEFWGSRLESNLLAHNFNVPPSPANQSKGK